MEKSTHFDDDDSNAIEIYRSDDDVSRTKTETNSSDDDYNDVDVRAIDIDSLPDDFFSMRKSRDRQPLDMQAVFEHQQHLTDLASLPDDGDFSLQYTRHEVRAESRFYALHQSCRKKQQYDCIEVPSYHDKFTMHLTPVQCINTC